MATEATINITSDITDSISFSISESMTMTQADGNLDLEETTGLAQRTFSGTPSQVVLIDVSAVGGLTSDTSSTPVAHKVYIRNTGTDKTKGLKIFLADAADDNEEIAIKRYKTYEKSSEPVINYYKQSKLLKVVNGEPAISEINSEISGLIDAIKG